VAPLQFVSNWLNNDNNKQCLEIFLGDLPPTAWSALVQTVTPSIVSPIHPEKTFVYMVGRSFYDCCAPSLDFSYCLVAAHWMKSHPADIPGGFYATDALHNTDPVCLQAWLDAGRRDFAEFTQARYTELKVGGCFAGALAGPKENGDIAWSKVALVIYRAWERKFDSAKELASCILPCCCRTEEDVRAGFDNDGWELEVCEFHQTKDPVRESLERGEISCQEYGRAVVESFKAVCHPTCLSSLTKSMDMPMTKVDALLNEAYDDCVDVIAADTEQYNLDVSFWYVLARKVK
jgi:SAM dependent carboxyl methyltransferase